MHSFGLGSDGAYPEADLINVGGTLYGITYDGGSGGSACGGPCGAVYSITIAGSEKVLHSFQGGKDGEYPQGQAQLRNIRGTLYGTTFEGGGGGQGGGYGVVFSVTPGGKEKIVHAFTGANGDYLPLSGLTKSGANFYGTTEGLPGSIYSITPGGVESVIYTFGSNPNDGYAPYAGLTEMQAKLYGTTAGGGGKGCKEVYGCGTVFSINP